MPSLITSPKDEARFHCIMVEKMMLEGSSPWEIMGSEVRAFKPPMRYYPKITKNALVVSRHHSELKRAYLRFWRWGFVAFPTRTWRGLVKDGVVPINLKSLWIDGRGIVLRRRRWFDTFDGCNNDDGTAWHRGREQPREQQTIPKDGDPPQFMPRTRLPVDTGESEQLNQFPNFVLISILSKQKPSNFLKLLKLS